MFKEKYKKRILVAGGAGFIGSNLCEYLISQNNFVIAFDNLVTGQRKNIEHLLENENFTFIFDNVLNNKSLSKLGRIDEVYHLASPASPPNYQKIPIETWKVNTLGTLNLLEIAKKNHAKFLFASTSEVYGDPVEHPQTEKYFGNVNPVGIRACYDESKRAGESICMDFFRQFSLNIKIVRIFNTYGPKMDKDDGRVISNFINKALKNQVLEIYGSGKQTRSFQYIDDLVLGMVKMMKSKLIGPVNLGNPEEFTIIHLARKIIKLTNSKSKIVYKKALLDDPKKRRPDISLAESELKWLPKYDLGTGLIKTVKYYKNYIQD